MTIALHDVQVIDTTIEDEQEIANLLQNYQQQASESLIVNNNIHQIVHGEGLLTKKVLFNQNCGELAFPQLLRFLQKGK